MTGIRSANALHTTIGGTAGHERGSCVDVAIIGATGRVGRRVLELIDTRRAPLQRAGIRLRVVAALNSRRLLAASDGLPPARVADLLPAAAAPSDPIALTRPPLHPQLLLDCTASLEI